MKRLSVVAVDDRLYQFIRDKFPTWLGPKGEFVDWEVMKDPDEARNWFMRRIPDVALIDLNFDSVTLSGLWGPPLSVMGVGFVLLAELNRLAKEKGHIDHEYQLYTGNRDTRLSFADLTTNPFSETDPLLPVKHKGSDDDLYTLIEDALNLLARRKLASRRSHGPRGLREKLQAFRIERREARERTHVAATDTFRVRMAGRVAAVKADAARRGLRIDFPSWTELTDSPTLTAAEAVVVDARLWGEPFRAVLEGHLKQWRIDESAYPEQPGSVMPAFTHDEQQFLVLHYPLLANLIALGDAAHESRLDSQLDEAVKQLCRVDHSWTLFTLFKTANRALKTVCAHAKHKWTLVEEFKASFGHPMPTAASEREEWIQSELGLSKARTLSWVAVLPDWTVERIKQDAEPDVHTTPFNHFFTSALDGPVRNHWCKGKEEVKDWLGRQLQIEVSVDEWSEPYELWTDWRLLEHIVAAVLSENGVKPRVGLVRTVRDTAGVWAEIGVTAEVPSSLGLVDLHLPQKYGTLTQSFEKFYGWGELEVRSGTNSGALVSTWPGRITRQDTRLFDYDYCQLTLRLPHHIASGRRQVERIGQA